MAKKPAPKPTAKPEEKATTSAVQSRPITAALDAVGRSLAKTFAGYGFIIVLFDKRKPEQQQHFLGGDAKASRAALESAIKKMGAP